MTILYSNSSITLIAGPNFLVAVTALVRGQVVVSFPLLSLLSRFLTGFHKLINEFLLGFHLSKHLFHSGGLGFVATRLLSHEGAISLDRCPISLEPGTVLGIMRLGRRGITLGAQLAVAFFPTIFLTWGCATRSLAGNARLVLRVQLFFSLFQALFFRSYLFKYTLQAIELRPKQDQFIFQICNRHWKMICCMLGPICTLQTVRDHIRDDRAQFHLGEWRVSPSQLSWTILDIFKTRHQRQVLIHFNQSCNKDRNVSVKFRHTNLMLHVQSVAFGRIGLHHA